MNESMDQKLQIWTSKFVACCAVVAIATLAVPVSAFKPYRAPTIVTKDPATGKRLVEHLGGISAEHTLGLVPEELPKDVDRSPQISQIAEWERFVNQNSGYGWNIAWDNYGLATVAQGRKTEKSYTGGPEAAARAFFADHSGLFMINDPADLRLDFAEVDPDTLVTRVKFIQVDGGLPVLNSVLGVIFDSQMHVIQFSSSYHPDVFIPHMNAAIDSVDAFDRLLSKVNPGVSFNRSEPVDQKLRAGVHNELQGYGPSQFSPAGIVNSGASRLAILPFGDKYRLVWEIYASVNTPRADFRAFFDAETLGLLEIRDELMRVNVNVYDPDPIVSSATVIKNVPLYRWNIASPQNLNTQAQHVSVTNNYSGTPNTSISNGVFTNPTDIHCPVSDTPCTTGNVHFDEQQTFYHVVAARDLFCYLNGGTINTTTDVCSQPALGADAGALNYKMPVRTHFPDAGPPADPGYDNAFYSSGACGAPCLTFGHGTYYEGIFYGLEDLALDAPVMYHEFSHYISDRITLGNLTGNYGGAMNEGIADQWGCTITDNKFIGAFAEPSAESTSTTTNSGFIRNMENTHQYCEVCRRNDCTLTTGTAANCEVHNDGEIYEGAMWQTYLDLRKYYGQVAGKDIYQKLVFQSEKNLSSGTVNFITGRASMLTADNTLNAQKYDCSIWRGFVSRGMGSSAAVDNTIPITNANDYTLPATCANLATVTMNQKVFACGSSTGYVKVADPVPHNGAQVYNVTVTTTDGDSETFTVTADTSPAASATSFSSPSFNVSIAGAVIPGNGKIEALSSNAVLTAKFVDADNATAFIADSAYFNCQANVSLVSDTIVTGSCDGNDPYLDKGETATLRLVLKNKTENMALLNAKFTLTSGNSNVTVNTSSVSFSRIDPNATVSADFSVSANASVTSADSVTYTVGVTADGINSLAAPISFTNLLERDETVSTVVDTQNFDAAGQPVGWVFFSYTDNTYGTASNTDWVHEACAGNPATGLGYRWGKGINCATKYNANHVGGVDSKVYFTKPFGIRKKGEVTQIKFDYKYNMDAPVSLIPELITDSVIDSGFVILDRLDADTTRETGTYTTLTYNLSFGGSPPVVDSSPLGFRDDATWFFFTLGIDATGTTPANGTIGFYMDNFVATYTKYNLVADATSSCSAIATTLVYDSKTIDDSAYCSADGFPDPGETIFLPVTLKNTGTGGASNVSAVLTQTGGAAKITILNGTRSFPNMAPGSTGTSLLPYKLSLLGTALPGEVFTFNLAISSTEGGAQNSSFTLITGHQRPDAALTTCDFESPAGACIWNVSAVAGENGASTGNWGKSGTGNNAPSDPFRRNCGTLGTEPAYESQPDNDHTSGAGVKCWSTDGATTTGTVTACGADDVDPPAGTCGTSQPTGVTSLKTANFDASALADPYFDYWEYIFNLAGAPSSTYQTYISNNTGGSYTLVSDRLCNPGDGVCANWINRRVRIRDYFAAGATSATVMLKFVARDVFTCTVSEAFIDDFSFYNMGYGVTAITSAPAEISESTPYYVKSGANVAITWTTNGSAGYNVVRGKISDMQTQGGVNSYTAKVYSTGILTGSTTIPQDNDSYFYLIQGYSGSGCQGDLGKSSDGIPRARQ